MFPGDIPISDTMKYRWRTRWRTFLGRLVIGAFSVVPILTAIFLYYNGLYVAVNPSVSSKTDHRVISLSVFPESIELESNSIGLSWKIIGDSGCFSFQDGSADNDLPPGGVDCSDVDIIITTRSVQSNRPSILTNISLSNSTTYRWSPKADSQNMSSPLTFLTTPYPLVTGVLVTHALQRYPLDVYYVGSRLRGLNSATGTAVDVRVPSYPGYTAGSLEISFVFPEVGVVLIKVSRRQLVWGYAFIIMVAIWIITLIFVQVTVQAVLFGIKQPIEVLVTPVGALFAFPQLRSTLPGIPEVSILDYCCFLPCLGILSFSAALILLDIACTDPAKDRDSLASKILCCKRRMKSAESIGSIWVV